MIKIENNIIHNKDGKTIVKKIINVGKSGVYKITNRTTNKHYIGQSINVSSRFYSHKIELKNNKHYNTELQNDWNSYGEQDFNFEIIERVDDPMELLKREKFWLEHYKENENVYNMLNVRNAEKSSSGEITDGMDLGSYFKHIALTKGYQFTRLAKKCDIPYKTLIDKLNNDRLLAYDILKLGRELGINLNEFKEMV